MRKAPSRLQDRRRGIYAKAKADTAGRATPGLRLAVVESGGAVCPA